MLDVKEFFNLLIEKDIRFFTGVPDSLLKEFCAFVGDNAASGNHIINANEGCSIALASGYHLATNKIALVYMQNSGLGNALNPLLSLADPEVYAIPMLLLIGWRGEPGEKDEPQHVKQGRVTIPLLETAGIPYDIMDVSPGMARAAIAKAYDAMKSRSCPYALVIRDGTFAPYKANKINKKRYPLSREETVKIIIDQLGADAVTVSTTGKMSRELYEYREVLKQDHFHDFLTVGSMGHCAQIALGLALSKPFRQIYCLDGDGAAIMHMGSLAITGTKAPENFKHIIVNNGVHDSVGGQETAAFSVDLPEIAKACGYLSVFRAESVEQMKAKLKLLTLSKGPALLEIRVKRGARKDLGRPAATPLRNKIGFMELMRRQS